MYFILRKIYTYFADKSRPIKIKILQFPMQSAEKITPRFVLKLVLLFVLLLSGVLLKATTPARPAKAHSNETQQTPAAVKQGIQQNPSSYLHQVKQTELSSTF